jgi:hypothetical protein
MEAMAVAAESQGPWAIRRGAGTTVSARADLSKLYPIKPSTRKAVRRSKMGAHSRELRTPRASALPFRRAAGNEGRKNSENSPLFARLRRPVVGRIEEPEHSVQRVFANFNCGPGARKYAVGQTW